MHGSRYGPPAAMERKAEDVALRPSETPLEAQTLVSVHVRVRVRVGEPLPVHRTVRVVGIEEDPDPTYAWVTFEDP